MFWLKVTRNQSKLFQQKRKNVFFILCKNRTGYIRRGQKLIFDWTGSSIEILPEWEVRNKLCEKVVSSIQLFCKYVPIAIKKKKFRMKLHESLKIICSTFAIFNIFPLSNFWLARRIQLVHPKNGYFSFTFFPVQNLTFSTAHKSQNAQTIAKGRLHLFPCSKIS